MEKSIEELIGKKDYVTKRDYLLCITTFLGYTPSDFEVSMLFQENLQISLQNLTKVIKYHNTVVDKELRVIEIFRLLDFEGKGFISEDDVRRIWKDEARYLSWDYISTCFREISVDKRIFYDSLKDMYLSENE